MTLFWWVCISLVLGGAAGWLTRAWPVGRRRQAARIPATTGRPGWHREGDVRPGVSGADGHGPPPGRAARRAGPPVR